MNKSARNRLVLIALIGLFALPLVIAWILSASGWHPLNTRSSGTLVSPPRDVAGLPVNLQGGGRLMWPDPQYRWTLLALPGAECLSNCLTRLEEVMRMHITLGRDAERLRVVYLGPDLPAGFLASHRNLLTGRDVGGALSNERARGTDALALALVDPRGLLMMRYAAGYSAQGLRRDIKKVVY